MGPGTSLVVFENLVIIQCDEDEGKKSFIVALDTRSGKEAWRVPTQGSIGELDYSGWLCEMQGGPN